MTTRLFTRLLPFAAALLLSACGGGIQGGAVPLHDTTSCVDNVLCMRGNAWSPVDCRCISDPQDLAPLCRSTGGAWATACGCISGTCTNPAPNPGAICPDICVPTCECPQGTLWDGGTNGCVTPDVCPGAATPTCPSGQVSCDGTTCTDLSSDPANCGACGNACGWTQTCSAGTCVDASGGGGVTCPSGQTSCDGATCTDLSSDPANCGACGNACTSTQTCSAGACVDSSGSTGGSTSGDQYACTTTGGTWSSVCGCGSGTCSNPTPGPICSDICYDRCACPAGTVWDDWYGQGCIDPSYCGF